MQKPLPVNNFITLNLKLTGFALKLDIIKIISTVLLPWNKFRPDMFVETFLQQKPKNKPNHDRRDVAKSIAPDACFDWMLHRCIKNTIKCGWSFETESSLSTFSLWCSPFGWASAYPSASLLQIADLPSNHYVIFSDSLSALKYIEASKLQSSSCRPRSDFKHRKYCFTRRCLLCG